MRSNTPRYVNQGPDRRIGGPVGHVLAWLQRTLSFRSIDPPFSFVWRSGALDARYKIGIEFSRPWLLPFVLVFLPRADWPDHWRSCRWRSYRAGWRWDANWPGYIADVIIKSRIDNLVE